jgi:pyrroloquinoline quinone biosynthesis protein D
MTVPDRVDADSYPSRRLEARTRRYRGKLLVANTETALELDEIAEFVFRQIDGTASLRDIGRRLADRYGGDVADAIADTAALVAELVDHHILELHASADVQAVADSSPHS